MAMVFRTNSAARPQPAADQSKCHRKALRAVDLSQGPVGRSSRSAADPPEPGYQQITFCRQFICTGMLKNGKVPHRGLLSSIELSSKVQHHSCPNQIGIDPIPIAGHGA
ncbi:hypothetical protein CC2G_010294 [Coprinopsis cinerea AmutBmut pab1-1]|nr:hypothetical protein CC2G_010294 [Coprinopsis cinerea AmutBmut pab1-1]